MRKSFPEWCSTTPLPTRLRSSGRHFLSITRSSRNYSLWFTSIWKKQRSAEAYSITGRAGATAIRSSSWGTRMWCRLSHRSGTSRRFQGRSRKEKSGAAAPWTRSAPVWPFSRRWKNCSAKGLHPNRTSGSRLPVRRSGEAPAALLWWRN